MQSVVIKAGWVEMAFATHFALHFGRTFYDRNKEWS